MSEDSFYYLLGHGTTSAGVPVYVALKDLELRDPIILVQLERGPTSENWELPATEVLEFSPIAVRFETVADTVGFVGMERAPVDWFKSKCKEANCEWFLPFVERIAKGEQIRLEEVEATHRMYNGKPLLRGKWNALLDQYLARCID